VRATLTTKAISGQVYVPYSDDPNDPGTKGLTFHGYFFEGIAQDHDELRYPGKAVQVCVYGQPEVAVLEEWQVAESAWRPCDCGSAPGLP
jgi:hypothetical protein